MATGDKFLAVKTKTRIGYAEFKDWVLAYFRRRAEDVVLMTWDDVAGLSTPLTITGSGVDEVSFTPTSHSATDGLGAIMHPTAADHTSISFENTAATDYYFGYINAIDPDTGELGIPSAPIVKNPRTGVNEYKTFTEVIGVAAAPDSVTYLSPTIEFVVDSVTQAGVDNSGRTVRVLKRVPATIDDAVAIEDLVVTWDGSNNKITTTGDLGQGAVSTTASDYTVVLLGPKVSTVDFITTPAAGVVPIGAVTGNGGTPSTFDTSMQTSFIDQSDLLDVVRIDTHGFAKIRVKADPSDSGEYQISVTDSTGATTAWAVDETGLMSLLDAAGDITIGNGAGDLDITFASASKALELIGPGGSPARMRFDPDNYRISVSDAGGTATLNFFDENTSGFINLSSAVDIDIDADLPQNILGALNVVGDHERYLKFSHGARHLDGGVITDAGGLTVNVTAVTVVRDNGEIIATAAASGLSLTDATLNYIIYDESSQTIAATTSAIASDDVLLGVALPSGSVAAGILIDARLSLRGDWTPREIVVGPDPSAHFASIRSATRLVRALKVAYGTRDYRILVHGEVDEGDVLATTGPDAGTGFNFVDGGGGNDSIVRNDGGSWITDGFRAGEDVYVNSANTGANNGTYAILSISASTLQVATGSLTADTGDNTAVFGLGPIVFFDDNTTVEGVSMGATVRWSGNGSLFDVNQKINLTFRDLRIIYDGTGTSTADNRLVWTELAGGNSTGLRIENIEVSRGSTGYIHGLLSQKALAGSAFVGLTMRNVKAEDVCSDFGLVYIRGGTPASNTRCVIENCTVDQGSGTAQGGTAYSFEAGIAILGGVDHVVKNCSLKGYDKGLYVEATEDSVYSDNRFNGTAEQAILTGGTGAQRNIFQGNRANNCADTADPAIVCEITGGFNQILDNYFAVSGSSGASTKQSLRITSGTDNVVGNNILLDDVLDNGTDTKFFDNPDLVARNMLGRTMVKRILIRHDEFAAASSTPFLTTTVDQTDLPALQPSTTYRAMVHAASFELTEFFAGTGITTATISLGGGADPDYFITALDVTSGGSLGYKGTDGSNLGVGYTTNRAWIDMSTSSDVNATLTTDADHSGSNLTAGEIEVVYFYTLYPSTPTH